MNPQNLSLIGVKYVCCEASVCSEGLSRQGISQTVILLCHVTYCLASSIHDDIFICLLKAEENVHHLDLPLYDQRAVVEQRHGRMVLAKDTVWIVWHIDGGKEIRRLIVGESSRDKFHLGWLFTLILPRWLLLTVLL